MDTDVFIGACLGSQSCIGVLEACLMGRAIPCMGTTLLAEFDAETRLRLRAAHGAGQEQRGVELLAKAAGES